MLAISAENYTATKCLYAVIATLNLNVGGGGPRKRWNGVLGIVILLAHKLTASSNGIIMIRNYSFPNSLTNPLFHRISNNSSTNPF
jgi:hypothetical protein